MSLALTHFAVGATSATLLLSFLPIRPQYDTPLIVASGIWAMVPDFWHVAPIYSGVFRVLGHSVFGNVFWLHAAIDNVDPHDSSQVATVAVGVYFLVALVYAGRWSIKPVVGQVRS